MRRRLLSVLGFAIVTALVASTLAYRAIAARSAGPGPSRQLVAVAARDLNVGALVQSFDIELVEWPGPVSSHWIASKDELVGRGLVANVYKGEPFLDSRIAAKGAGAGLAAIIPAGMRAVAVRVDEVVGVSGFVLPGMRVDVLATGALPGQSSTVTRTILQNIDVLSAGQNLERDQQGRPSPVQVVNLLVTPDQAEALSLAAGQTKVQLVLRNPTDTAVVQTAGISNGRLLGMETPRPAPTPAPRAASPRPAPVRAAAPAPPKHETVSVPVTVDVITGVKKDSVVVGHTTSEQLVEVSK